MRIPRQILTWLLQLVNIRIQHLALNLVIKVGDYKFYNKRNISSVACTRFQYQCHYVIDIIGTKIISRSILNHKFVIVSMYFELINNYYHIDLHINRSVGRLYNVYF